MTDTNIDTILEPLAEIGRGWVHDQLDGTSFIKDALDGIEEVKEEAKAQIKQLITEELKTIANVGYDDLLKTYDYDAIAEALLARLAALQGEKE